MCEADKLGIKSNEKRRLMNIVANPGAAIRDEKITRRTLSIEITRAAGQETRLGVIVPLRADPSNMLLYTITIIQQAKCTSPR